MNLPTHYSAEIQKELRAMREIGIRVPPKAVTKASDLEWLSDYTDMSVSECASMLIELYA